MISFATNDASPQQQAFSHLRAGLCVYVLMLADARNMPASKVTIYDSNNIGLGADTTVAIRTLTINVDDRKMECFIWGSGAANVFLNFESRIMVYRGRIPGLGNIDLEFSL